MVWSVHSSVLGRDVGCPPSERLDMKVEPGFMFARKLSDLFFKNWNLKVLVVTVLRNTFFWMVWMELILLSTGTVP